MSHEEYDLLPKLSKLETTAERAACVKPGTFLDVSPGFFNAMTHLGEGPQAPHIQVAHGLVRMTVEEVLPDDTVEVEAEGVRKKVHASLFYNYGRSSFN